MTSKYDFTTEVAIIGAGPAGAAASMELAKSKIPHFIIDKAIFPRDKICGDGLSPKTPFVLNKIDPKMVHEMIADTKRFTALNGGYGSSPNGAILDAKFEGSTLGKDIPFAFTSKRFDFDQFLIEHLDAKYATTCFDCNVTALKEVSDGIEITYQKEGKTYTIFCKIIIGADGDRSIVKKTFAPAKMDPAHYVAGVRAYLNNVKGLNPQFEFHFLSKVMPGYFWIFPLPNGDANIGIGMLSEDISKRKINLRELLMEIIKTEPRLKERFATAEMQGKIQGWGLPLGSKLGTLSGNKFILTGDAGSFIDPISGEGIANAIYTGMYAAQAISAANGDFSAKSLKKQYDERVHRTMGTDLKMSYIGQRIGRFPAVINFIFKKVERSNFLRENLNVLTDLTKRNQLYNPLFLLRVLWIIVNPFI